MRWWGPPAAAVVESAAAGRTNIPWIPCPAPSAACPLGAVSSPVPSLRAPGAVSSPVPSLPSPSRGALPSRSPASPVVFAAGRLAGEGTLGSPRPVTGRSGGGSQGPRCNVCHFGGAESTLPPLVAGVWLPVFRRVWRNSRHGDRCMGLPAAGQEIPTRPLSVLPALSPGWRSGRLVVP